MKWQRFTSVALAALFLSGCTTSGRNQSNHSSIEPSIAISQTDVALSDTRNNSNNSQPSTSFPRPVNWQSDHNLNVSFIEDHSIGMVDVQLNFNAGSLHDSNQYGLAALTNRAILTGSARRNEQQINQRKDELGAKLSSNSGRDMATINMRCLSDSSFKQCQQLLNDILQAPSFNAEIIARLKQNFIVAAHEASKNIAAVSSHLFWHSLFPNHAYGKPVGGNSNSIKNIEPQHIRDFYQRYYNSGNANLVIVGDLSLAEAKQFARSIAKALPQGEAVTNPITVDIASAQQRNHPFDSQQNHIYIGHKGVPRSHPDYVAFFLANHALGGGALSSIIGNEIREKRGWAYSVWSNNVKLQNANIFMLNMQTKPSNASAAIDKLKEIIANGADYLSDEKIEQSRQFLIGNFPLQLDSNAKLLNYQSVLSFNNLAPNYLERFYEKLSQVSYHEVRQAWQNAIDADDIVIINVGKHDS